MPLELLAAELVEDLGHGLAHHVGQHVQAAWRVGQHRGGRKGGWAGGWVVAGGWVGGCGTVRALGGRQRVCVAFGRGGTVQAEAVAGATRGAAAAGYIDEWLSRAGRQRGRTVRASSGSTRPAAHATPVQCACVRCTAPPLCCATYKTGQSNMLTPPPSGCVRCTASPLCGMPRTMPCTPRSAERSMMVFMPGMRLSAP